MSWDIGRPGSWLPSACIWSCADSQWRKVLAHCSNAWAQQRALGPLSESKMKDWLDEIKWDSDGLVPAIAQDHKTGRVLMMAWMNREALVLTAAENRAIYWSRSRGKLWRKGEESGHVQKLHEMRLDCDGDVIILMVEQVGDIACHTGRQSCFYRVYENGDWKTVDPVLKDPHAIYKAGH
jgi:phosphoribosyl-AMP cyclohydrolase